MKAPDAFRTISEVAEDLDLPQHVLRFWETRFAQIKPMKRGGGRRYYRPEDVDLLRGIRLLLYGEGFTIRGVQRLLKEKGVAFVVEVGQTGSVQTVTTAEPEEEAEEAAPVRRRAAPKPVAVAEKPAPPVEIPSAPKAVFRLAPEKRRRMEAALNDLLEAKSLLEQAR
jgi:DNA-binding transcriptional MerR regulator